MKQTLETGLRKINSLHSHIDFLLDNEKEVKIHSIISLYNGRQDLAVWLYSGDSTAKETLKRNDESLYKYLQLFCSSFDYILNTVTRRSFIDQKLIFDMLDDLSGLCIQAEHTIEAKLKKAELPEQSLF